jgi:integrase/recombinase XerD
MMKANRWTSKKIVAGDRRQAMTKAYLEVDEVISLEESATNIRDRLLVRVLFHLGCRISEALAITVEDIDFERGTVTIIHLKRRVRISCIKCGARLSMNHNFCPKCGVRIDEAI